MASAPSTTSKLRPDFPSEPLSSAHQISEDKFMSEEDHRKIRSLTALLARLGVVLKTRKGRVSSADERGPWRTIYEHVSDLAHLLVREHEVLGVTVSGEPVFPEKHGQVNIINNAKVLLAINPRQEEHLVERTDVQHPHKIYLQANAVTEDVDPLLFLNPVKFWLDKCIEAREEEEQRVDIYFSQHVTYARALVVRLLDAESSEKRRTCEVHLRLYTFATCHKKMLRRLRAGQDRVHPRYDFYTVLTEAPSNAPHWLANDIPSEKDFLSAPPTTYQQHHLEKFKNRTAYFPADVETRPVYDVDGRRRLQFMLSTYIKDVEATLETLAKATDFQRVKSKTAFFKLVGDDASILSKTIDASVAVRALNQFVTAFDKPDEGSNILLEHLSWLFNVRGMRPPIQEDSSSDIPSSEAAPPSSDPTDPGHAESKQQEPSSPATNVGSSGAPGIEKGDEGQSGAMKPEELKENGNDDGKDEKHELEQMVTKSVNMTKTPSGYSAASRKWLQLILTHDNTLMNLVGHLDDHAARQEREKSLVKNSKFTVVDIQRGQRKGRTRDSFRKCLDLFVDGDDKLNKEDLLEALSTHEGKNGSLVTNPSINDWESFGGDVHTEAVLLGLSALANMPGFATETNNTWLCNHGVFATTVELVSMFKGQLPLVPVSKRCCPACTEVCRLMAKLGFIKGSESLHTSGTHTVWSAVELPPFLPKKVSEGVLAHVEAEVTKNLHKLQKRINAQKSNKSNSDKVSENSQPNSSSFISESDDWMLKAEDPEEYYRALGPIPSARETSSPAMPSSPPVLPFAGGSSRGITPEPSSSSPLIGQQLPLRPIHPAPSPNPSPSLARRYADRETEGESQPSPKKPKESAIERSGSEGLVGAGDIAGETESPETKCPICGFRGGVDNVLKHYAKEHEH